MTVGVTDVVRAASKHGVWITSRTVLDAVNDGELASVCRVPLRFDVDEANRWLGARSGR